MILLIRHRQVLLLLCTTALLLSLFPQNCIAQQNAGPGGDPDDPDDTLSPSSAPTAVPTAAVPIRPTQAQPRPTLAVTRSPVQTPSATDTTTAPATEAPTVPATEAPTLEPTEAPVATTRAPVTTAPVEETPSPVAETEAPTEPETDSPTATPTAPVTEPPTAPPTGAITDFPTKAPETPEPTLKVIPVSTPAPTRRPTGGNGGQIPATSAPTSSPTFNGKNERLVLRSLELTLNGVSRLDADSKISWANVTKHWYQDFYKRTEPRRLRSQGQFSSDHERLLQRLSSAGIADLETNLVITDQRVALSDQGLPVNTLVYAQELDYKIVDPDNLREPEELVLIPFLRADDKFDYVQRLQQQDLAFRDLSEPELPYIPGYNDNDDGGDDGGLSMGIIIGIAVGGAVFLLVICFIVYKVTSRNGDDEDDADYNKYNKHQKIPTTFALSVGEDISTIHEPYTRNSGLIADSASLNYGDQSVATVDYDYTKAYGGAGDNSVVSSAGGTMGENTRQTPDEMAAPSARAALGASFDSEGPYDKDPSVKEEIIEIIAPAGKLGVVIDTPDDGAPVVHAVKDASVIADQIRVGDKLVAVDDQDVTAMTAIKVSKLISKKSANPTRKLTVIRSSLMYDADG